ncbi:RNA polymerase sigma factor, partial [Staphylococcus aureus]
NASPITPAARTDSSDAALLAAVAGGDARAFSELYDRHASAARRRALRYCGSPWDAEEILQESFVSVWVSARTYDAARATVRTWILALVS